MSFSVSAQNSNQLGREHHWGRGAGQEALHPAGPHPPHQDLQRDPRQADPPAPSLQGLQTLRWAASHTQTHSLAPALRSGGFLDFW